MLRQHLLGNTGLSVSPIGLGTVKFGRNADVKYPESFALPSDSEILRLLDCCESLGINLLDTAPAYGVSEERLGRLLGNRRQHFVLSTKVGETWRDGKSFFDFSPLATKHSVEQSLERLKTDYLDIVLVHSNGLDEKIIRETGVFETLQLMKENGWIRAFGMSSKTVSGGQLAVAHSDVVMVTYHPEATEEQPVIASAHAHGKGVLIKKALKSGHLAAPGRDGDPVLAAMQFIFREPGVHSIVIGTLNEQHLRHNVTSAIKAIPG